jgi:hypothetical protein
MQHGNNFGNEALFQKQFCSLANLVYVTNLSYLGSYLIV